MRLKAFCLILAMTIFSSVSAHAAAIEYIFTGVGTGTLGPSDSFNGAFTVTYSGDTANIMSDALDHFVNPTTSGTFAAGALSANFNAGTSVVLFTTPAFPNVGFAQSVPAPVFGVNESAVTPALIGYDLSTAFPLSSGSVSYSLETYLTDHGDLTFNSISSLGFEAVTPSAVPLPASLPLFMAALMGLGLLSFARRTAKQTK